jgi:hypothetical protein
MLSANPLRWFVIHSDSDVDFARDVRSLLTSRVNAEVFTTEDKRCTKLWLSRLRDELSSSDVIVALLTPNSVETSWVLQEIGAAWALRKPIIPVVARRDLLNRIPVSLDRARSIELTEVATTKNATKFVEDSKKAWQRPIYRD